MFASIGDVAAAPPATPLPPGTPAPGAGCLMWGYNVVEDTSCWQGVCQTRPMCKPTPLRQFYNAHEDHLKVLLATAIPAAIAYRIAKSNKNKHAVAWGAGGGALGLAAAYWVAIHSFSK
jgi:hypothetical protein